VTVDGIEKIVRGILSGADAPAVFCLEGGYDLDALAESVFMTLKTLVENKL
jgi:acetoin utilization deacetylase AcuC-like enzyme